MWLYPMMIEKVGVLRTCVHPALHHWTLPLAEKKGREQLILLGWERLRPGQLVVCVHLSGLHVGGMVSLCCQLTLKMPR